MSLQINHEDLFKSLNSYNFLIPHMKINLDDLSNHYNYNNNLNQKKSNILIEDAIKEIFPLAKKDDINNEKILQNKLYEITNSTDCFPRDADSPKKIKKAKKKIFIFKKVNKYIGRRKQNNPKLYKTEANHNKYKEDNMVNKIKIYFINSIMTYLNQKYKEYMGIETKKLLAKIKPNFTKVWTKKENQEYLKKKIKDIFAQSLSNKCKRYPKNYNITQIEMVIKNNEAKDIINILNKSVKDMYEIYIDENKKIEEFHINNDLIKIEKRNGKEYVKEYKRIAINLINILNKRGRKD